MKKQQFLNIVAPLVVAENERRGKPLFSSVVIAQAICESGWGTSQKMMKANAIFGIKAGSSWNGKVYSTKTRECYDGVNYTTITDLFRAYNNLEESVKDYFNLILNLDRYEKAVNCNTPLECITEIKNGGYATSPTYINTIMSIINDNNLTKYDVVENVENSVDNSNEYIDLNVLADKVISGGFGNGYERKQRLGELYDAVQEIVNERYKKQKSYEELKVGDKVEVINNKQYNGKPFRSYYKIYNVIEIKNDRVVIGIGNTITCAINIKNIRKVK